MENKELISSGLDAVETMISYLAKDSIGSEFLNEYMGSRDAQFKAAENQREALSKLISSSAEMEKNTKEISNRAENNVSNMNSVYAEIEKLKESVNQITEEHKKYVELFDALLSQTGKITNLVDEISNISEQTNLLSFNASIEAAHAGAAGAGFRIIANEVKKLSDGTRKTSEEIKYNVELLKKSINGIEDETQKNQAALKNLTAETDNTLGKFDNVRKMNSDNNISVERISSSISSNVTNINSIISHVQEAEKLDKKNLKVFAECASKNQMLFNDLYSFIYEIKAVLEDLNAQS